MKKLNPSKPSILTLEAAADIILIFFFFTDWLPSVHATVSNQSGRARYIPAKARTKRVARLTHVVDIVTIKGRRKVENITIFWSLARSAPSV